MKDEPFGPVYILANHNKKVAYFVHMGIPREDKQLKNELAKKYDNKLIEPHISEQDIKTKKLIKNIQLKVDGPVTMTDDDKGNLYVGHYTVYPGATPPTSLSVVNVETGSVSEIKTVFPIP